MSRKPVFGDKSSIEAAQRFTRARLGDMLDVVALKTRGVEALERDEQAIRSMIAARDAAPVVEVTRKKRVGRARINTIAPSEYTGKFRVVHKSIDTYIANLVGGEVREDFMTLLPEAQEDAKAIEGPALSPFPPFLGENLSIKPRGGGTFAYLVGNADVTVKIRKEGHASALAAAQVLLTSACLHRLGYVAALRELADWVKVWCPSGKLQPSRVDLCADTQGWVPEMEDIARRAFVCPCPRTSLVVEAGAINYMRWGTGGKEGSRSGPAPIQLVVYDKTEEIRVSDKGWFVPLWAQSPFYIDGDAVHRIEARFTREWLKERGIETQPQLLALLGEIWAAALEWCRYSVPADEGEDGNRSRWKVRDEWRVLRSVDWSGADGGKLERIDQARPRLERTLAALGGHFVTLQALFAYSSVRYDLWEIAELAVPAISKRWEGRGEEFAKKVEYRRVCLGGVSLG